MKKRLMLLLVSLFSVKPCLALAENSYALQPGRLYLGLEYGISDYRDHQTEFSINNVSGQAGEDKDSRQYKLTIGFNYTRNIALEFQYADLGEVKVYGNSGDSFTSSGIVTTFTADNSKVIDHYKTLATNAILKYNFSSSAVYGKIGILYLWNYSETYSAGTVIQSGIDFTNFVALQGVGYEYHFSPRISARIEYAQADIGVRKVILVNGGLMIYF